MFDSSLGFRGLDAKQYKDFEFQFTTEQENAEKAIKAQRKAV